MLTMECFKTKNNGCGVGFLKAALMTSCLWVMLTVIAGWAVWWRLLQLWGPCLNDSDYTNATTTTQWRSPYQCDPHSEVEFKVWLSLIVIVSVAFFGWFIFLGFTYSIPKKSTATKSCDYTSHAKTIVSHKLVTSVTDDGRNTLVEHLLGETWRYDERLGRDAKALKHKSIKVKSILHVKNEILLQQYRKESQATLSYDYPDELKQSPILTTKVTLDTMDERKNADLVEGSSDNLVTESSNMNKESLTTKLDMEPSGISKDDEVVLWMEECQKNLEGSSDNIVAESSKMNKESLTTKLDMEPSGISKDDDEVVLSMEDCQKNLNPGEIYLFHGTKLGNIPCILETGFDLKRARTGQYGRAIYLAESSEKADQYADYPSNRRETDLAMLVVRVALGRMHCHMEEGRVKVPHSGFVAGGKPKYDTVVAGHNKRFREFLVYNQKRIYPEYVVLYDRIQ